MIPDELIGAAGPMSMARLDRANKAGMTAYLAVLDA